MNTRGLIVTLAALVGLVILAPALTMSLLGPGMMASYPMAGAAGMMWGGGPIAATPGWLLGLVMGLGSLAMLAYWGVLIIGGVLLYRSVTHTSPDRGPSPSEPSDRANPV